ncbi:C40 family peptidase [bacterium]|nr:C40 family peptidase [bacterium]
MLIWKKHLILLIILIIAACSTNTRMTRKIGQPGIETISRQYLGVPYRYGGMTRRGMDCSGLICKIFRDYNNSRLPHQVSRLIKLGRPRILSQISKGDLIFFKEPGNRTVTHVGLYLGDMKFIHASKSHGVTISSLKSRYYRKRYNCARAILH